MRKLYALLAGIFMLLAGQKIQAQTLTPDIVNFNFVVDAPNNYVTFTNTSILGSLAGPRKAFWNFGDGIIQQTAPLQGTSYHYTVSGSYNVCLRLYRYTNSGDSFLTGQVCKEVIIESACRADFERLPVNTVSNPLHVAYKAFPSHNANKKPVRICWEFGDGRDTCINYATTFSGPYTVSHNYPTAGLYEVCVKIRYDGGCEARKCKPVHIGPVPDSCTADFERFPIASTANPLDLLFKALPHHNNNKKPVRICWEFGDGRDTCINYPTSYTGLYLVPHRYTEPGMYNVCVKIRYDGGCEARKCKPVQVGPADSCTADFERIPVTSSFSLMQGFRALPWHNNNKKPVRICWQFGDGEDTCIIYPAGYTGQYTVTHRYDHPGQYEVCVKILYAGGCEARKCKLVSVPPVPVNCRVQIFEITPSITSLVRGFLALPHTDPYRRPVRVCWYFGDGQDTCIMLPTSAPLTSFFIRHTYPAPGVYRACVKILFDGGCVAEDCKEVIIRSASNICGGFMIDSLTGPRTFKFRGHSINNPNDEVIGYRWSFGDGTSAFGREVMHTYSTGGTFEVCLQIKTRLGCETKICKTVRVPGNNLPALHLSPNPVVNVLHVNFFSTHTEQVTIRILNSTGTPVRTYIRNVNVGANNWDHDLASLVPGIYSYIVQSPNQLASAIFIKQ